jgi:hypothetical protein
MDIIINDKKLYSFEIVKYHINNSKIEISMIKALDEQGNYIKFVKLDKVLPYLSKFPIYFKNICNE